AGASVGRRVSRHRAVLPAVLTVLLLAVPVGAFEAAGGRLVAADIASLLLVAAGIVAVVRGRRRALGVPGAAVFAAAVLALGVVHLTSTGHPDALVGWVRYLQVFVLVPLAVVVLVRDRRDARAVGAGFLVLALAQGTLGILQYATGTGASYMGEDIRAVGTFGPQNVMGMSTVVCFGLLVAVCGALAPPPGAPRWWRPAAVGCAGWLLLALAVSFSRGAWIAAAVACAAVVLLSGALTRRAVTALCVLVVLAGGTAVTLSGRLADRLTSIGQVTGTPDQSVVDRYAMWDAARSMWRQEPWTGVGLKGFPAHRDAHASVALSAGSDTAGAGAEFQRQALESPHNMYLLVLGEQGLVGATALIGGWAVLLAGCLLRVRAARRLASGAPGGGTGRGLFGGVGPLGLLTARPGVPDVGLLATGLMIWLAVTFAFADIGGPTTVATAVVLGLVAWWAVGTPSPATAAPAVGAAPGDAGADTAPNGADGDAPETGTPAARLHEASAPGPARPDADGADADADGAGDDPDGAGDDPDGAGGDASAAVSHDSSDGRAEAEAADMAVVDPEAADPDAAGSEVVDPEVVDPEAAGSEAAGSEAADPEATDRGPTDGAATPDGTAPDSSAIPDSSAGPGAADDDSVPEAGSGAPCGPAAREQREAP
ncbi:O-antigen ligase family protein, partial [Streptomyces bohaiensis]|uniref:O-antigen ligase family protein n=1 Tax=Streptomyces bohaiensis TaxID=1431344 RepID=UPI001FD82D6B